MMRLSDLLHLRVTTEAGESLGHVHDVRGELTTRTLKVTGLVVGRIGVFERFGLGAPESRARGGTRGVVPWSAVVRADRRGVVVKEGTEPQ